MVAVMAYTMLGQHSPLKCLVGAAALVGASVAMAPLARRSAAFRGHLLDFWAMALAMLVLLPQHPSASSETGHSHGAAVASGGFLAALIVCVGWAIGRAALFWHDREARGPASVISPAMSAVGLALTVAFCG
jgi:hypothetical protein